MDNQTRRILLERVKASGFPGSILDVFQNPAILDQFIAEQQQSQLQSQQQSQPVVAQTPQEQEQGLRPAHAAGNVGQSMIFPNVEPNQSFNTVGMKIPIDINKVDNQGNLVESYKAVPPGIQDLPTGPNRGMVIESPAEGYAKTGGIRKYQTGRFKYQAGSEAAADATAVKVNPLVRVINIDEPLPNIDKPLSNFDYQDYYDKANKYLSRDIFKGTTLTAKDIADAANEFYTESNYQYPLDLLLTQAQIESKLGKQLKSKHNYFNVGNTDSGATRDFASAKDSVRDYINLMYNDYLNKGQKSVDELLKPKGFVNYQGNRYASNPDYENMLSSQMQFINNYLKNHKTGGVRKYQTAGPVPTFLLSEKEQKEYYKYIDSKNKKLRNLTEEEKALISGDDTNVPDSKLEDVGEIFDFTGVLSHDDAKRAYNSWKKSGRLTPNLQEALDMFSAIPGLGKYSLIKYIAPGSGPKFITKNFNWQQAVNLWGQEGLFGPNNEEENKKDKENKTYLKGGLKNRVLYNKARYKR